MKWSLIPAKVERNITTPTQGLAFQMMTESFGLSLVQTTVTILSDLSNTFWYTRDKKKKKTKEVNFSFFIYLSYMVRLKYFFSLAWKVTSSK